MRNDGNGKFRLAALTLLAAAASLAAPDASAYSNSPSLIANRTLKNGGAGCAGGGCHGTVPSAGITVTIAGPTALNAGELGTYTVTATRAATTNGTKMGHAVAASDSPTPLQASTTAPNTLDASGEVIHAAGVGALRTTTSNAATYDFRYTMPAGAAAGSTHTLYAVAALSFLGYNHANNFTVTTRPTATTTATASSPTSSSINLAWTGGGPEYRVVYKAGAVAPANENDGTNAYQGTGVSTVVAGLSPSTQYSFRVFSKLAGQSIFATTGGSATASTTAVATIIRYVNAASGNNTANNCTSAGAPCRTITYAMGLATAGNPGDTVSVAPGTYDVALGEVFPIALKSGVTLVSSGGPAATVIDGAGDTVKKGLLASNANASTATRVEGFTIANALNTPSVQGDSALGGAMRVQSAVSGTVTVTRNIFRNNEVRGYSADGSLGQTGGIAWGGALYVFSSTVNVTNNVFVGNLARGGDGLDHPGTAVTGNETGGQAIGGALYLAGAGVVANNTFHSNRAMGGTGGLASNARGGGGDAQAGAFWTSGTATIYNNVFARNTVEWGVEPLFATATGGAVTRLSGTMSTNLFHLNSANGVTDHGDTGTSPLIADPQFHNEPDNLRPKTTSPVLNAGLGVAFGTPDIDIDGLTRGAARSLGAYEPTLASGPSANVSLAESISPATASTGKDVIYTFTVSNAGPNAAPATRFTGMLPSGAKFIWATPGCSVRAAIVTCEAGTLAAGASVQYRYVVRPLIPTSLGNYKVRNRAFATGAVADTNLADNGQSVATNGTEVTVNLSAAGAQVLRYRLFSPVTSEHLYTTDLNEYNVLGSLVGVWVQEGTVGKVLNNPAIFGGVQATPYYRLYNTSNAQHHWTTDPNEYYTLILFPQYNSEGVDGYIFPTQAAGTIPLYRLLYPFTVPVAGLHHWTIDVNEYNALIATFGWVGEGGSGFVIP